MNFLNFSRIQESKRNPQEEEQSCCRYDTDATNFIAKLLSSYKCNCVCLAVYVLAVAEEFQFEKLLRICHEPGHAFLVIIDPIKTQENEYT